MEALGGGVVGTHGDRESDGKDVQHELARCGNLDHE